jgi:hypothetical protein
MQPSINQYKILFTEKSNNLKNFIMIVSSSECRIKKVLEKYSKKRDYKILSSIPLN